MEKTLVNINEVKENPENPRLIKDGKFKKLVKSIKEFPRMLEIRPIVVNDQMIVLGGNMRLKACKAAGLKEVWIIKALDLTPEQQKEFVIKDNTGYGEWDWEALKEGWDLNILADWGLDLPEDQKPKKEAKDDGYEIPQKISERIKLGDLIEIGPHRLLCGSATESSDVQKLMADKKAKMVHTDPPYNVNYEGGTGLTIQNDNMSSENFYKFLIDSYKNMIESLEPGGAFYIWHAGSELRNFLGALLDTPETKFSQWLFWKKSSFILGRSDYHFIHEPCIYGWKKGAAHNWYGDRKQHTCFEEELKPLEKMTKEELLVFAKSALEARPNTSVAEFDKPIKSIEHPTMKPVELCGYYIGNSSQETDIVLDLFLGSGSTMVAAHQLGRICYGTELDPFYCDVIIDRMRKLDTSLTVKLNGITI